MAGKKYLANVGFLSLDQSSLDCPEIRMLRFRKKQFHHPNCVVLVNGENQTGSSEKLLLLEKEKVTQTAARQCCRSFNSNRFSSIRQKNGG